MTGAAAADKFQGPNTLDPDVFLNERLEKGSLIGTKLGTSTIFRHPLQIRKPV